MIAKGGETRMSKIFTVSDAGLPFIVEGEYKAQFKGYEEKTGLAYGDALRINFEISEGEYQGTVLNTLVSQKLSPQSRLGLMVKALTKKPLKKDTEVNLDELVGTKCIIRVATVEGKGNYGDFSTVAEVKPISENEIPF